MFIINDFDFNVLSATIYILIIRNRKKNSLYLVFIVHVIIDVARESGTSDPCSQKKTISTVKTKKYLFIKKYMTLI